MTFYVDNCRTVWRGCKWSHLVTDGSREELVAFAKKIGLKEEYIQGWTMTHFDVTTSVREKAIRAGAKEIGVREMGALIRKHRHSRTPEFKA